jgi:hypothetical protein
MLQARRAQIDIFLAEPQKRDETELDVLHLSLQRTSAHIHTTIQQINQLSDRIESTLTSKRAIYNLRDVEDQDAQTLKLNSTLLQQINDLTVCLENFKDLQAKAWKKQKKTKKKTVIIMDCQFGFVWKVLVCLSFFFVILMLVKVHILTLSVRQANGFIAVATSQKEMHEYVDAQLHPKPAPPLWWNTAKHWNAATKWNMQQTFFARRAYMENLTVVDLDETLISCSFAKYDNLQVLLEMENEMFVYPRPHVDEFLRVIFAKYNVYIWTAAAKDYAMKVLEALLGFLYIPVRILTRNDTV